jgi:hypothetical protein
MMHPANKDDEIDSSNVQYARQNLVLKDGMYEQPIEKQHILKLSSLGININETGVIKDKFAEDRPVAFDINLQIISILNHDETIGNKYQFHIMVYDQSFRSPVLNSVKKKMDDKEFRSILLLNPSYKLGDDNIYNTRFRLDSTSIIKQLEYSNVRICDTSRTLHKDL